MQMNSYLFSTQHVLDNWRSTKNNLLNKNYYVLFGPYILHGSQKSSLAYLQSFILETTFTE